MTTAENTWRTLKERHNRGRNGILARRQKRALMQRIKAMERDIEKALSR
jgi:hypothetical protein